jgi:hypothetical protein
MLIFVGIFALGLVALIAYFALSKKSSPTIRWTAIAALILIGLSVIVCLVILFSGLGEAEGTASVVIAVPLAEEAPANSTPFSITIFVAVFLIFLVAVIFFALREQRRQRQQGPSLKGE